MVNRKQLYDRIEWIEERKKFIEYYKGSCQKCGKPTENIMRRIPVQEVVDKLNEKDIDIDDVDFNIFFQKAFLICYECNRESVNIFLDKVEENTIEIEEDPFFISQTDDII